MTLKAKIRILEARISDFWNRHALTIIAVAGAIALFSMVIILKARDAKKSDCMTPTPFTTTVPVLGGDPFIVLPRAGKYELTLSTKDGHEYITATCVR